MADSQEQRRRQIISKALRRLALERDVEGPYYIADHLIAYARSADWPEGELPARSTIADSMSGKTYPSRRVMELFVEGMNLSREEAENLAWVYMMPFRPAVGELSSAMQAA